MILEIGDRRAPPPVEVPGRVLGTLGSTGARAAPLVLLVAGMHGNEPAGVIAVRRVLDDLGARQTPVSGRVVALAGNLGALARSVRFIDRDLNRVWTPERLADHADTPRSAEDAELHALLTEMRREIRHAAPGAPVYCVDLHTTSADGPPFVVFSDTLRNRRFVRNWPCPLILGVEERIGGSLSERMSLSGAIGAAFEAGRHDDPASVDLHEAAVRIALVSAGCVREQDMPKLEASRRLLREASRGAPRVLDVIYRHGLAPDHAFVMAPGFPNFTPVARGQRLGQDASTPVCAERTGRILLPLYQGQGDDGYFIARVISRLWLGASALLRRTRADLLVTHLPGVRRVRDASANAPASPRQYEIDRRVARWLAEDVFHLAGFRVVHETEDFVRVARRPHDRRTPARVEL